ncbi:MAG TPA: hypothetical protein VIJ47_15485 [Acidimicrobiales bacterium]
MTISAEGLEQLREITRREDLDLGRPKKIDADEWTVEAYGPQSVVIRLRRAGLRVDVDSEFEARAAARRTEVGTGDRFEGGRIPPRGLGRKE